MIEVKPSQVRWLGVHRLYYVSGRGVMTWYEVQRYRPTEPRLIFMQRRVCS